MRLPLIVIFCFTIAALYTAALLMAIRLWRLLRSGTVERGEDWRLGAWVAGLVVSMIFVPPALVGVVPAAYILCYRPLRLRGTFAGT